MLGKQLDYSKKVKHNNLVTYHAELRYCLIMFVIQRLNNLLVNYLKDDDLESSLDVGGDMRKIQYCYCYLKKRIKEQPQTEQSPLPTSRSATDVSNPASSQPTLSPAEIQRLRELLQQRDNEISKMYV